jgi:feruloyl esterase
MRHSYCRPGALLSSLLIALGSGAATPALAAGNCAALSKFTLPGHRVVVSKAWDISAGQLPLDPGGPPSAPQLVPAHCRVDGVIDARTGRDGKPYGIGFAVTLPAEWNGRFLFQGGGGLNGSVAPPRGATFAGGKSALERGFAVASTDSGHQATGFDAGFFQDQSAALNFLYQAVAEVTVVAKAIVQRHYGRSTDRSYFVGCSTGGREAMMMSQRFPNYFDGIVAGAPAMRTSFSNLGLRHAATALKTAPLSETDRAHIIKGVLEACDALDGNKDGFIFAPQSCRFDPGALECQGAKTESCLTSAQVGAVRTVMQGPRTPSGRQVYPGYYYDTGIATTRGLPGILAGPFIPEGPAGAGTMDVEAAAAAAMDARAMVGDTNAWTNLDTFRARGGKLIFLHGVSDPWFSAQDTVQYYERLGRDNAGVPLADWSRLFLVPGMGHCGGGERTLDRFDMLDAIVGWVEGSRAPQRVIATAASAPAESRPLCPYPMHAQLRSGAEGRDAAQYDCAP